MTTEKPDVRVLCRRCWKEYLFAGIHLIEIYSEHKESCFKCGSPHGYEYVEVKRK